MAEGEPLSKDQLIAVVRQLRELRGTVTNKPDIAVDKKPVTLDSAILGFSRSLPRVDLIIREHAVLDAYEHAFLVAAGEKPPVFLIDGQEKRLDLQGSSEGGK